MTNRAIPAVTETHGTLAEYEWTDGEGYHSEAVPVVAWDTEGFALVPAETGHLARAVDLPHFYALWISALPAPIAQESMRIAPATDTERYSLSAEGVALADDLAARGGVA